MQHRYSKAGCKSRWSCNGMKDVLWWLEAPPQKVEYCRVFRWYHGPKLFISILRERLQMGLQRHCEGADLLIQEICMGCQQCTFRTEEALRVEQAKWTRNHDRWYERKAAERHATLRSRRPKRRGR